MLGSLLYMEPFIKDIHSQEREVVVQCRHSGLERKGVRSGLQKSKNFLQEDFLKFMICQHAQGELRQCRQGAEGVGQFFMILCGCRMSNP